MLLDIPNENIIEILSYLILPEICNLDFIDYQEHGDTNYIPGFKIAISKENSKCITVRDNNHEKIYLTRSQTNNKYIYYATIRTHYHYCPCCDNINCYIYKHRRMFYHETRYKYKYIGKEIKSSIIEFMIHNILKKNENVDLNLVREKLSLKYYLTH